MELKILALKSTLLTRKMLFFEPADLDDIDKHLMVTKSEKRRKDRFSNLLVFCLKTRLFKIPV